MKRFRFSLQALRTLRLHQEQRALRLFGLAIAARAQATRDLEEARRHCDAGWQANRQSMNAGVTAAELVRLAAYCRTMEQLQRLAEANLSRAQRTVDERWEKLLIIRQQREAVDKYYQRLRGAYERHLSREEQKALDDMAYQRPAAAVAWKTDIAEEVN